MKRRNFLASVGALSTVPLSVIGQDQKNDSAMGTKTEYIELIKFRLHTGSKKKLVSNFYRDVAIPALNRAGIKHVGVFNVKYGPNDPTLYVLIPHQSFDSIVKTPEKLLVDKEYLKAGESFLNAPLSDSAYVRMEKTLQVAFTMMPKIEVPNSLLNKKSRIYELRIYESHSQAAGKRKIEMFNEGGEIEIFKKTGLQPVLFAETLFGPQIPNLMYMLVFENMASRDKSWDVFRASPEWAKLKADAYYKDTVSNITDIILRPTSFSQI
jgi:hypothetical protein